MYKYFISYFTQNCKGFGFGNLQVNMKNKIISFNDLLKIEEIIAKNINFSKENIKILNYILLSEEEK